MRYGNRIDDNHAEVRDELRRQGWAVLDTHDMPGFVDLIAKLPYSTNHSIPYFIDVKDGKKPPSARRLTDAQKKLGEFVSFFVIKEVGGKLIPWREYLEETE